MADLSLLCVGKSREFRVLLSALNSVVYGFPLDVAAGNLPFISGGSFILPPPVVLGTGFGGILKLVV